MNFFSSIPYQKTKNQIVKSRQVSIKTGLVKLFGICSFILLTSQNVHAFDLQVNITDEKGVNTTQTVNWTYQDLVNGNFIKKIPSLLTFKRQDAAYIVSTIKNKYLTFYSNKNEKLKATYAGGAYFIKYTHRW